MQTNQTAPNPHPLPYASEIGGIPHPKKPALKGLTFKQYALGTESSVQFEKKIPFKLNSRKLQDPLDQEKQRPLIPQTSDAFIRTSTEEIPVSLSDLALLTQSRYFIELAKSPYFDRSSIDLTNMAPHSSKMLLDYIFEKRIPESTDFLNLDHFAELYAKAHEWQLSDLKEHLSGLGHTLLNGENALFFYDFAKTYQINALKSKARRHIFTCAAELDYLEELNDMSSKSVALKNIYEKAIWANLPYYFGSERLKEVLNSLSRPIPQRHLIPLSASQLATLFEIVPDLIKAVDLSIYEDFEIADLCNHLPALEELNLEGVGLSDETILNISRCTTLRRLNLQGCSSRKEPPNEPSLSDWQPLVALSGLTFLNVNHCFPAAAILDTLLKKLPLLQELHIGKEADADRVARALAQNCSQLIALNLSHSNITREGLNFLASNPKIQAGLKKISLAHTTSLCFEELIQIGPQFPALSALNLSSIPCLEDLDEEQNSQFATLISALKFLKDLKLRNCQAVCLAALNAVEKNCPELNSLDISNCGVSLGLEMMWMTQRNWKCLKVHGNFIDTALLPSILSKRKIYLYKLYIDYENDQANVLDVIAKNCRSIKALRLESKLEGPKKETLDNLLPNLQKLRSFSLPILSTNLDALKSISLHCPRLTSLECIEPFDLPLLTQNELDEIEKLKGLRTLVISDENLENKSYSRLASLLPHLEILKIQTQKCSADVLTKIFCSALKLKKFMSVGSQNLQIQDPSIFARQKRLTHLQLDGVDHVKGQEIVDAIQKECPRFKEFHSYFHNFEGAYEVEFSLNEFGTLEKKALNTHPEGIFW